MVYIVSTFTKVDKFEQFPYYGSIRSVGLFDNYSDAKGSVVNNICDIHEDTYEYAVIETFDLGIYPSTYDNYNAEYYKWDGESYQPIDKSEVEVKHVQPIWSIG